MRIDLRVEYVLIFLVMLILIIGFVSYHITGMTLKEVGRSLVPNLFTIVIDGILITVVVLFYEKRQHRRLRLTALQFELSLMQSITTKDEKLRLGMIINEMINLGSEVDLSGKKIKNFSFSEYRITNLRRIRFFSLDQITDTSLESVDFSGCDCSHTIFSLKISNKNEVFIGKNLSFANCNLVNADFSCGKLQWENDESIRPFEYSDLCGTSFRKAALTHVDFRGATNFDQIDCGSGRDHWSILPPSYDDRGNVMHT